MKRTQAFAGILLAPLLATSLMPIGATEAIAQNSFEHSDFVETEQPELTQETKDLISAYQKSSTEENYVALRDMVIQNYNAVLDRKEAKLAELRVETAGKPGGEDTVAEMEDIVQDMYATYWNRINSSMLRFTDTRLLKWKTSNAAQYDFIPVMGAGESIYVSRTPVTNAQYAAYVQATGAQAPSGWENGTYPEGEGDFPVNFVSTCDAQAYCAWLTQTDGANTYRLPNESEWELAAGHMPKDADFNCGVADGRVSVYEYDGVTRGAHGAIDFWGNVWEWTSTARATDDGVEMLGVKGGAWDSERTDCRTENRKEARDASQGYEDVGFRVIMVQNGVEPDQKVELATLDAPIVKATSNASDSITFSWDSVEGANQYQIFEYFEDTGLISMLNTTPDCSVTIEGLEEGSTHSYIVQPISYVEICDNVSPEYRVTATCGVSASEDEEDENAVPELQLINVGGLNCWLYAPEVIEGDMPLIVYLHGITGRGDDPQSLLYTDDFAKALAEGEFGEIPAYVLMPQAPSSATDWPSLDSNVIGAIDAVKNAYPIDPTNVSLTGFSMGGTGAWSIAVAYPDEFARIAPCAGGIRAKKTALVALADMPIWAFVGADDNVVKPQSSIDFIAQLSQNNSQAKITVLDGAAHTDVPGLSYLDKENDLFEWLIGKQ